MKKEEVANAVLQGDHRLLAGVQLFTDHATAMADAVRMAGGDEMIPDAEERWISGDGDSDLLLIEFDKDGSWG